MGPGLFDHLEAAEVVGVAGGGLAKPGGLHRQRVLHGALISAVKAGYNLRFPCWRIVRRVVFIHLRA